MASGKINVSTQVLTDTAQNVENLSTRLNEKLEEVYQKVKNLESSYQSKSGQALRAGIDRLRPSFADYKSTVDSYAAFLRNTAQTYETLEQTLTSNAENTAQFSQPS